MNELIFKNIKLYIPDRYNNQNLLNRFKNNTYENEESLLVNKYLNKNDNVLELGSCLGYITSILSKKTNYVISFEANPELTKSLDKLKETNNLHNVTFYNNILDIKNYETEFDTYDLIVAGSADRKDNGTKIWENTIKKYIVTSITPKDIDLYNKKINTLVIDIEGGELKFLLNFTNLLKDINKIIIELHQHLMNDNNFNKKCINILENHNFKIIEKKGCTFYFEKKT